MIGHLQRGVFLDIHSNDEMFNFIGRFLCADRPRDGRQERQDQREKKGRYKQLCDEARSLYSV